MTDANHNPAPESNDEGISLSEAARESRRARARGGVTEFADAFQQGDTELVEKMERIMEPIAREPDSFEAIINYGHEPLETLGKIANDMIKVQGDFNKQVNIMGSAIDRLEGGMGALNLAEIGEKTRAAAEAAIKGAGGVLKGLADAGRAFTGKKSKKDEHEQFIESMQDALPEMLMDMIKLVNDIKETEKGLEQVRAEAIKLGKARVEATKEISIYLGTRDEVLKRYDEEYIPEAKQQFEESQDPEDEMYLNDVIKRKENFIDRMSVLEGSRAQGVIAAQQLRQIIEMMEDQRTKIQEIIHNSQNEWKAMMVSAGVVGSSLKVSQMLKKADKFGDDAHDQIQAMLEESHEILLNSKSRGTIDPAKLIEGLGRIQQMIEKENVMRQEHLQRLEATRVQLRGATDRLIEAADTSKNVRILEATQEEKAAAETPAENAPVNDNETETPEVKQAPKRKPAGPKQ